MHSSIPELKLELRTRPPHESKAIHMRMLGTHLQPNIQSYTHTAACIIRATGFLAKNTASEKLGPWQTMSDSWVGCFFVDSRIQVVRELSVDGLKPCAHALTKPRTKTQVTGIGVS